MRSIGLDVGGSMVKMGIVEEDTSGTCELIEKQERPSPDEACQLLRLIVDMALDARLRAPGAPVGVSCAGWVREGGVVSADNLKFEDAPLGAMLKEALGEEAPVANDANLALYAEWLHGALRRERNCVLVTIGTGIGGGVVCDGRLLRGYMDMAGELGHMITHRGGLPCVCGQEGCYEMYAAAPALSRLMGGLSVRDAVDAARAGRMLDKWNEYLDELCAGLESIMSIFAPTVVALGGGLSNAGAFLLDGVRGRLAAMPGYRKLYPHVRVELGHFANDAGMIGAAAMAREGGLKL